MKIGYPCINLSLESRSQHTFRLASFSSNRFHETVQQNLLGLEDLIRFNIDHQLLFLRIGSGLIPFASHPICRENWQESYREEFLRLGEMIKNAEMRISMHPDQFTLINSVDEAIFQRTILELLYHEQVLSLLGLDQSAKLQIHVGGVYGDKKASIERFIARFNSLPELVKKRLVIENDDRLYTVKDCLVISQAVGVPVLFDSLHHECLNNGEDVKTALVDAMRTWKDEDGVPMIDYSQQEKGARVGNHAKTMDREEFLTFLNDTRGLDYDVMLEIKDKERSALKAIEVINQIPTI